MTFGLTTVGTQYKGLASPWFDLPLRGWFNIKISTQAMMRCTANKTVVMSALRSTRFVLDVVKVGMLFF